ncbi:hypothetical protein DENIS_0344 [Desulfonema ishimotonii]|uniref:Cytosol aminopeptidase domain-containing protein n=1 Tax=Desulfonema ishimotonii TaxID=45657 RepID=A0A401FR19_9BACT|nr:DUF1566 domain-containing protein [Desulfonema ishimotonii]GBC59405.1 hypothetical protein DENIS_0344 [Desulfonema ishimotonii]
MSVKGSFRFIFYAIFCLILFSFSSAATSAILPDTGQTGCYDASENIPCPKENEPFYGQDAQYANAPRSFTKMDAAGNILPDSATEWAIVLDNVTGLMWEVKTADDSVHGKYKTYSKSSADDFIDTLNWLEFGGFDDWRLPTLKELSAIVNRDCRYPATNEAFFPNARPSYYWTRSSYGNWTSRYWCVSFEEGAINWKDTGNFSKAYARAVRGGDPLADLNKTFQDNGDGTVTDLQTGMMWQQQTIGPMDWQSALAYCENLNLGNHDDWRLPNINELINLADFYKNEPVLDTTFFPGTKISEYWTSTTWADSPTSAWTLRFATGHTRFVTKTTSDQVYFRAVRDGLACARKTGLKASSCIKKSNWPGALAGYGIDPASGAQILSSSLLAVSGALPVSFGLTYNSLIPEPGIVGRGWGIAGGLGAFLEVRCKDATVHWSNIRANRFVTDDGIHYSSPDQACHYDRLVQNDNGTYTLTRRSRAVYEFDADGRLLRLKNHIGQSLDMTYDADGRLKKVTESVSGGFLDFTYHDDTGFLKKVTDPAGRTVQLEYDDNGDLIGITSVLNHKTVYTYNKDGQVLNAVNADGDRLFENEYDEEGRVGRQDDGRNDNQKIEVVYSEETDAETEKDIITTTVKDRMGYSRVYRFDEHWRLAWEKDELGNTAVQVERDENGNATKVTDANGNATTISYDDNGNVRSITDAESRTDGFSYNTVSGITILLEQQVRYDWAIPTGLTAGNYTFRAQVRKNGAAVSPWSDAQAFTVACSAAPTAETVAVTELATDTGGVSCAGDINLQARISNTGTAPLSDNTVAYFIITGPDGYAAAVGKADVSGLGAGVNIWFGYSWTVPDKIASGTYSYRVRVRSENGDNLSAWSGEKSFDVKCADGPGGFVSEVSGLYPPEDAVCDKSTALRADIRATGGLGIPLNFKVWFCITGPDGKVVEAGYVREDRNLNAVTDAMGNTSARYEYNDDNTEKSVTDALGRTTRVEYNDDKQPSSVKSPEGNTTSFEYENGRTSKITAPEGNFTKYQYDAVGRVVRAEDAEGFAYTYAYDADCGGTCREDMTTDPLGNEVKHQYNSRGNLIRSVDARLNDTVHEYDGNGNRIRSTDAEGRVTTFEYDGEDRPTRTVLPGNRVWERVYDAKGRLIRTVDPLENVRKTEYDNMFNIVSQTDFTGKMMESVTRDKVYNPLQVSDALNRTTRNQYDKLDRLTQVTDPKNRNTGLNYDDIGQLTSVTDAKNQTTSQKFDDDGNLTEIQDAKGNRTEFSVDRNGRPTEQRSASGSSVKYGYDARSLMNKLTNGRNQDRTFSYDALGRITQMSDPDGAISYTYDQNSNVLTVTDTTGTITRVYDKLNRVTRYTDAQGNVIQYAYNNAGNLEILTYPDGKQVRYGYDLADRMTSVTDWDGRITRYEYDANSRLIRTQRPYGSVMTRTYDAAGQMTQQKDVDAGGQVIAQYDFQYDAAGNITEETVTPQESAFAVTPVTMTYTSANHLATYNGQSVDYDADGNMTHGPLDGGMADFVFDSRNRLTQAGDTQYVYDAEGNRVRMEQNGGTTRYAVNPNAGLSQVFMETAPDGTVSYYVYGQGLIGRERAGAYRAYHFDFRGSTVAMTDESGAVTHRYAYSPYGRAVKVAEEDFNPFRYVGQYGVMWDDCGLYYMRARFYEAGCGRFLSEDLVWDGVNFYVYGKNNPVNRIDPLGESPVSIALKRGAIYSAKKALKEYAERKIKRQLAKRLSKKQLKEFGDELVDILDSLDSEWWEIGIEFIPVAGDIYGGSKFAIQLNRAWERLRKLEGKFLSKIRVPKNLGRTGKQARLRELANDPKVSSADRGWIKNEIRHIETGSRKTIRLPGNSRNSKQGGKVLAHPRGKRAKDGWGYEYSNLQDTDLHKLEHKYEGY